jgi:hypothetical protein
VTAYARFYFSRHGRDRSHDSLFPTRGTLLVDIANTLQARAKWSFDVLDRVVPMNTADRDFARIGMGEVPHPKTLARITQALGREVIAELHWRLLEIAQEIKRIKCEAGRLKRKVRNSPRSISKRVVAIATASRNNGEQGEAERRKQFKELPSRTPHRITRRKRAPPGGATRPLDV